MIFPREHVQEAQRPRWRRPGFYILIAIASISIPILIGKNREAAHIEDKLRVELKEILPPPGATLVGEESRHKPGSAFIGLTYSLNSDFNTARVFYERELASKGWTYHVDRRLGSEVVVEFCKRPYAVKIDYAGDSVVPAQYRLYVDWNLNDCP